MNTNTISETLVTLFRELVAGAPKEGAFILNPGDPGLLASLDRISAQQASAPHDGAPPVAAHVDHIRYGLSLLNRWAAGENPFADARWSASWELTGVSEEEWAELKESLGREVEGWEDVLASPREVQDIELNGMVASIAHLSYHLGALRQVERSLRGPEAND